MNAVQRLVALWRRPRSKTAETAETVVAGLALALLVRSFVVQSFYIPSESMLPTLRVNDRLFVEKLSYRLHPPHRGDIVVFHPPKDAMVALRLTDTPLIKRVIGLPGDRIAVHDGKVWRDGRALTEPYIADAPDYEMPERTVPPGDLFVMGDNRNDSADSHIWGFLPESDVIGRAVFRFWPLDRVSAIESPPASSGPVRSSPAP